MSTSRGRKRRSKYVWECSYCRKHFFQTFDECGLHEMQCPDALKSQGEEWVRSRYRTVLGEEPSFDIKPEKKTAPEQSRIGCIMEDRREKKVARVSAPSGNEIINLIDSDGDEEAEQEDSAVNTAASVPGPVVPVDDNEHSLDPKAVTQELGDCSLPSPVSKMSARNNGYHANLKTPGDHPMSPRVDSPNQVTQSQSFGIPLQSSSATNAQGSMTRFGEHVYEIMSSQADMSPLDLMNSIRSAYESAEGLIKTGDGDANKGGGGCSEKGVAKGVGGDNVRNKEADR